MRLSVHTFATRTIRPLIASSNIKPAVQITSNLKLGARQFHSNTKPVAPDSHSDFGDETPPPDKLLFPTDSFQNFLDLRKNNMKYFDRTHMISMLSTGAKVKLF